MNNNKYMYAYDAHEGYTKGTMFPSVFTPYKNYTNYSLNTKTREEKLLHDVMMYDFALEDLGLYLDINPEDNIYMNLFRTYYEKYVDAKNEYESSYGPLEYESKYNMEVPYKWEMGPWPWEVK